MKRLTLKDENGYYLKDKTATITWNSLIGENRYRGEAVDRLAAIEDILGDEYDLDRLRELAEADREGRCVVLPCKVEDDVYINIFGRTLPFTVISISQMASTPTFKAQHGQTTERVDAGRG